jgi:hypothetical protein
MGTKRKKPFIGKKTVGREQKKKRWIATKIKQLVGKNKIYLFEKCTVLDSEGRGIVETP